MNDVWITGDGDAVRVKDMTNSHLCNALRWLERTTFQNCGGSMDETESFWVEEIEGTDHQMYPIMVAEARKRRLIWNKEEDKRARKRATKIVQQYEQATKQQATKQQCIELRLYAVTWETEKRVHFGSVKETRTEIIVAPNADTAKNTILNTYGWKKNVVTVREVGRYSVPVTTAL